MGLSACVLPYDESSQACHLPAQILQEAEKQQRKWQSRHGAADPSTHGFLKANRVTVFMLMLLHGLPCLLPCVHQVWRELAVAYAGQRQGKDAADCVAQVSRAPPAAWARSLDTTQHCALSRVCSCRHGHVRRLPFTSRSHHPPFSCLCFLPRPARHCCLFSCFACFPLSPAFPACPPLNTPIARPS